MVQYPALEPQLDILVPCLRALPDVLTGRAHATEILFPHASIDRVGGLYKGNSMADYFNQRLADVVAAYVKQRSQKEKDSTGKISILEIGAGTGAASAFIFKGLYAYADQISYLYTDVSKRFLTHAQEDYGKRYPFVDTQLFNVEEPITAQGLMMGSFDLVVAANVIHATHNICHTLKTVKALLKRNGLLILNELCSESRFLTLTFGLLDGWWFAEDDEIRLPGSPGLAVPNWELVLKEQGFDKVFFPDEKACALGQQVVVARSNGIVSQQQTASPLTSCGARPFISMKGGEDNEIGRSISPTTGKSSPRYTFLKKKWRRPSPSS